jgi:pterin-4a-carbinolamine dehydratase
MHMIAKGQTENAGSQPPPFAQFYTLLAQTLPAIFRAPLAFYRYCDRSVRNERRNLLAVIVEDGTVVKMWLFSSNSRTLRSLHQEQEKASRDLESWISALDQLKWHDFREGLLTAGSLEKTLGEVNKRRLEILSLGKQNANLKTDTDVEIGRIDQYLSELYETAKESFYRSRHSSSREDASAVIGGIAQKLQIGNFEALLESSAAAKRRVISQFEQVHVAKSVQFCATEKSGSHKRAMELKAQGELLATRYPGLLKFQEAAFQVVTKHVQQQESEIKGALGLLEERYQMATRRDRAKENLAKWKNAENRNIISQKMSRPNFDKAYTSLAQVVARFDTLDRDPKTPLGYRHGNWRTALCREISELMIELVTFAQSTGMGDVHQGPNNARSADRSHSQGQITALPPAYTPTDALAGANIQTPQTPSEQWGQVLDPSRALPPSVHNRGIQR